MECVRSVSKIFAFEIITCIFRSKKRNSGTQMRTHRKERDKQNSGSSGSSSTPPLPMSSSIIDVNRKPQNMTQADLDHSPAQCSLNRESDCGSASASAQTSPTSSPAEDCPLQIDPLSKSSTSSMANIGDCEGNPSKSANRQSKIFASDPSPAVIAQTNWTFVETMLNVSFICL